MITRLKFNCYSKTQEGQVTLGAVYSGSEENKQFFKWTPSGNLVFGTINEDALAMFEPGKEYYLDITPCE